MSEYLVEVYLSQAAATEGMPRLSEIFSRRGGELTPGERGARLLRWIFVPEDETCFLLFEGPSGAAVRTVAARTGLPVGRVVEAVSEPA